MAWNILFLSANPLNEPSLRTGREYRSILDNVEGRPVQVKLVSVPALQPSELSNFVMNSNWRGLHFAGHGNPQSLLLEQLDGHAHPVSHDSIIGLFEAPRVQKPEFIFLNACYTKSLATKLSKQGIWAFGTEGRVEDTFAIQLASEFYGQLAEGYSIQEAIIRATASAGTSAINHIRAKVVVEPPPPNRLLYDQIISSIFAIPDPNDSSCFQVSAPGCDLRVPPIEHWQQQLSVPISRRPIIIDVRKGSMRYKIWAVKKENTSSVLFTLCENPNR